MEIIPSQVPDEKLQPNIDNADIDKETNKRIMMNHSPDGHMVDVESLFLVVQDIRQRAIDRPLHVISSEDIPTSLPPQFPSVSEALAYTIHKISCEISLRCSGWEDVHEMTMAVFDILSSYVWEAKIVLAIAAFAMNYGEFWLVAQLYTTNQIAKSIALLKKLPKIVLKELNTLTDAMMHVTKLFLKTNFTRLMGRTEAPVSNDMIHIRTSVYWTIRSTVVCFGLIGLGLKCMLSEDLAQESSRLANKLYRIQSLLQDLKRSRERTLLITEIKQNRSSYSSKSILRAFINAQSDPQPFFDGSNKEKQRVSMSVEILKNMLLLISDLDISHNEIMFLDKVYKDSRNQPNRFESDFHIVWLPMVDWRIPWTEEKEMQFKALQSMMPWYSVHHPSSINLDPLEYIKNNSGFEKTPILMVLDKKGEVVNPNALPMIWIWGSVAYPFTCEREKALWKEEIWGLEFLVDAIDPLILDWIKEEKFICLYGGEDIEWIRRLTSIVGSVPQVTNISIEMVYVGSRDSDENVRNIIATITQEHLSYCWEDLQLMWHFWVRLEGMWNSKLQLGKAQKNDSMMQEIEAIYTLTRRKEGWAMISGGTGGSMTVVKEVMLTALSQIDKWKENAQNKGFMQALNEQILQHRCKQIILPGIHTEMIMCAECGLPMEQYFMYEF